MAQIGLVTTAGQSLLASQSAWTITRIEAGSGRQSSNPEGATSVTRLSPRQQTINPGGFVDGNTIVAAYSDDSSAIYDVREFGMFARPTGGAEILFGYFYDDDNSATFLLRKTASGQVLRQLRVAFANAATVNLTISSPTAALSATTGRSGISEYATQTEYNNKTANRTVTANLEVRSASTSSVGGVELATQSEVDSGSAGKVATTNLLGRAATTSRRGVVELATSAEVTSRSGSGVVRASDLPATATQLMPGFVWQGLTGSANTVYRELGSVMIQPVSTTSWFEAIVKGGKVEFDPDTNYDQVRLLQGQLGVNWGDLDTWFARRSNSRTGIRQSGEINLRGIYAQTRTDLSPLRFAVAWQVGPNGIMTTTNAPATVITVREILK